MDPTAEDSFAPDTLLIGGRTPYALLTEVLSHNKILPRPVFTVSGPNNSQLFTCTITFLFLENGNQFSVTGPPGSGKKAAQHSAAITAFNYIGIGPAWIETRNTSGSHMKWLLEGDKFSRLVGTTFVAPDAGLWMRTQCSGDSTGNETEAAEKWILKLKMFADEKNFEQPEFVLLHTKPPSHQPTFTMACSVKDENDGNIIQVEMKAMTNKKQLKRMISQKLLMQLYPLRGMDWDGPPMPPGEIFESEDSGRDDVTPTCQ